MVVTADSTLSRFCLYIFWPFNFFFNESLTFLRMLHSGKCWLPLKHLQLSYFMWSYKAKSIFPLYFLVRPFYTVNLDFLVSYFNSCQNIGLTALSLSYLCLKIMEVIFGNSNWQFNGLLLCLAVTKQIQIPFLHIVWIIWTRLKLSTILIA